LFLIIDFDFGNVEEKSLFYKSLLKMQAPSKMAYTPSTQPVLDAAMQITKFIQATIIGFIFAILFTSIVMSVCGSVFPNRSYHRRFR